MLLHNMVRNAVQKIKKTLAAVGVVHPSLGVKIGGEAKAALLLKYKLPSVRIFVETGTEYGAMIDRIGTHFEHIYTIEYDEGFYRRAVEHFKGKSHIEIFKGDSGDVIQTVLGKFDEPALIWLDAHGPGEMTLERPLHCPVERELKAIFKHPHAHTILIDDARHFDRRSIRIIAQMAKTSGYTFAIEDGLFILKHA